MNKTTMAKYAAKMQKLSDQCEALAQEMCDAASEIDTTALSEDAQERLDAFEEAQAYLEGAQLCEAIDIMADHVTAKAPA